MSKKKYGIYSGTCKWIHSILIAVAMLFALLGTTQKEHYKRRSCNVSLHWVMDKLEECYKCFSIGPHRCYQNYDATKEFVCKCGNLIFPLAQKQNKICCMWCGQDVTDFNHILICPERKVNTFQEFIRYKCICAEIKEKWVLWADSFSRLFNPIYHTRFSSEPPPYSKNNDK